jgi:hypothetical protein
MNEDVGMYLRDAALSFLLGPVSLPFIAARESPKVRKGDPSGLMYPAAVAGGSLGMSYATLQLLNFIQGPKYAIPYSELRGAMTHGRYVVASSIAGNPLAVSAGGIALGTAVYPEISGRTYQGKMSGQPTIGRAGHDLIYNPERISLGW